MGPKYGPISGNEQVYTLLKGRITKDELTVLVTENSTGWRRQLPFTKNGNLIYFSMPPYPLPGVDQGVINITICYRGEELHQSPYIYQGSLDRKELLCLFDLYLFYCLLFNRSIVST